MSSEVDTIMVPSTKVGRIIGKKGSKIRELEQNTNTHITINRSDDDEVRVDVQGSRTDVEECKSLIQQLIQADVFGGYGGGGGGGGYGRDRDQNRGYGGGGGYGGRSRDQQYDRGGGYGRDREQNRSYGGGYGSRSRDQQYDRGDRNCYNCGEPGHISRNCPG